MTKITQKPCTIRLIARGKAAAPVEFGAKLDLSIDENGIARLEKLSFDTYNESDILNGAIERYRERTGRYPESALADKIYRNRDHLAYCKLHGIRLSGPRLGRPKKDAAADKKTEYCFLLVLVYPNGQSATFFYFMNHKHNLLYSRKNVSR